MPKHKLGKNICDSHYRQRINFLNKYRAPINPQFKAKNLRKMGKNRKSSQENNLMALIHGKGSNFSPIILAIVLSLITPYTGNGMKNQILIHW